MGLADLISTANNVSGQVSELYRRGWWSARELWPHAVKVPSQPVSEIDPIESRQATTAATFLKGCYISPGTARFKAPT